MIEFLRGFAKKSNSLNIKEGDIFYSEYFKSKGEVVTFISDNEWYFKLENSNDVFRAKAKPIELKWLR